MAVTQTLKSGGAMRTLVLLGVFIVAKLTVLAGRPVQFSLWTPVAYFWQDVLVALVFALLDGAIRRAWFGWTLYGAIVLYVAINVPIARVLSSPLTWPMLGAAGGALSDSIKHHATPANLALMSLVAAAGIALPFLTRRLPARKQIALFIPALLIAPLGPFAISRIEPTGLHRNAIMALATTALPRLSAPVADVAIEEDWRRSLFGAGSNSDDLSRWRGAAAGRNVVLIALESAGAEHLRLYGASRDPMPNLSEAARAALVFENAYAVYPESIKALFSILCSRYPAMDTETGSYVRIITPSLASVLKSEGYRTALFH